MSRAAGVAEARRTAEQTAGFVVDAPVRPKRAPWVLLGILIVAGGALGFGVWGRSLGERVDVLAAGRDLAAGEEITPAAFRIVEIAGGEGGRFATPSMIDELTGQVVIGPVPAGTLLNRSMFATAEALDPDRAVVAAVLSPGEYPSPRLRIGTTVVAIRAGDRTGGLAPIEASGWPITIADVVSVDPLDAGGEPGGLLVGLETPAASAVEITDAAAADRLRLAVIAPETAAEAFAAMRSEATAARTVETGDGSDIAAEEG